MPARFRAPRSFSLLASAIYQGSAPLPPANTLASPALFSHMPARFRASRSFSLLASAIYQGRAPLPSASTLASPALFSHMPARFRASRSFSLLASAIYQGRAPLPSASTLARQRGPCPGACVNCNTLYGKRGRKTRPGFSFTFPALVL